MYWTRKVRKKNLPNGAMENKEVETIIQEIVDGVKVRDFALVWEDIKHDVQPLKKEEKSSKIFRREDKGRKIFHLEDKGR